MDTAGNLYLVGNRTGYYGGPSTTVVLKISPQGSIVWEKQMPWSFGQAVYAVTLDAYGNLWMAGYRQPGSGMPFQWAFWQMDSAGNILREVIYAPSPYMSDQVMAMGADPFGNVLLAGNTGYWPPLQPTPWNDIQVMKYGIVSGVEFRGKALLSDVALYPVQIPVEVELRQGGQTVRRDTVYVDGEGRFVLHNVPPGVYDVAFKGQHWLRRVVPQVSIAEGTPEIETYLINGDIDGDNEVTLFDFGLLVRAFGSGPHDANWNMNADLDVDAEVTLFDFAVIVFNFGEIGDD